MDHEAIRKAYPNVVLIEDSKGAFDASGNAVTIVQSNVDAARVELDKDKYRIQRTGESDPAFPGIATTDTTYASMQEQLDMQYWDAVNGTTTWKDHIAAVKAKYPKPS